MKFFLVNREVKFVAIRSRGPGGQNVNKVSSAALLLWNFEKSMALDNDEKRVVREKLASMINGDDQVYLRSDVFRDLERNKSCCLEKLEGALLRAFHKPKLRHPTKPTYSSKVKRRVVKNVRSVLKKQRRKVHSEDS